ncbi:hypothetical protein [Paraburkholderia bannensis]|uniref:hypothetical protein n=1 Tax=Paraburkholderia bannensis TaxID=765414 RepID=UPI002AB686C0|nr:hypothetical protein [Paraburkholderia bannensis]
MAACRWAHREFVGGGNNAAPTINSVENEQQIQVETAQGIVHAVQYSLNRMQRRHFPISVACLLDLISFCS